MEHSTNRLSAGSPIPPPRLRERAAEAYQRATASLGNGKAFDRIPLGDETAFQAICDPWIDRLHALARLLKPDRASAEEPTHSVRAARRTPAATLLGEG